MRMARTGTNHLAAWRVGALVLFVLGSAFAIPAWSQTSAETPGLTRIDAAVAAGRLDVSTAARQKLFYLFDRSRLDAEWQDGDTRPVRCGTLILSQIAAEWESLDPETRKLYDTYTLRSPSPATILAVYETTHFYIEYDTNGA